MLARACSVRLNFEGLAWAWKMCPGGPPAAATFSEAEVLLMT